MQQQHFSYIHVDIVGPLPVSKKGFRYLFTIIYRSSRILEAVPLANVEMETCRDVLISQWVAALASLPTCNVISAHPYITKPSTCRATMWWRGPTGNSRTP